MTRRLTKSCPGDTILQQLKTITELKEHIRIQAKAHGGLETNLKEHKQALAKTEAERDLAWSELAMFKATPAACALPHLERRRLPNERGAATKTFRINGKDDGVSAHVHCGEREDGSLAEVFVRLGACHDKSKPRDEVDWQALAIRLGYLARTMSDAWATVVSLAVQYGVPIRVILEKHVTQQDVAGYTNDKEFPRVLGLLDFMARWMRARYVKEKP
jgi:hypothetical protein